MRLLVDLLKEIVSKVNQKCLTTVCEDNGCCLSLQGIDPSVYALLAMDGPTSPAPQNETRCDFLFFGRIPGSDRFWVSPVELTRGNNKSSTTILDQLRAGGRLAEHMVPTQEDVQFAPVAAGPFRKYRRLEFRKRENSILFRNHGFLATTVECCSELLSALTSGVGGQSGTL